MLRLLEPFEGTQLAAYGMGALPLMTATVKAGGGRYTGLLVRWEKKRYGAMRRIDGAGDRSTPVIVVDDSMSSGTSFREACAALEDEEYKVEGTACLVDFSSWGGRERAEALGYRVAISFNIWDDLGMRDPDPIPGFVAATPAAWSERSVPSGLHPAEAARRVAEHLIAHDEVLGPPTTFDRIEDGGGGTFVSLRRRHDDQRLARRGFWHFDPNDADPCRDLVLATAATLRSLPRPLTRAELDVSKFAVSFFGPLEAVAPAALDFSRYGIVVRSRVVPRRRGGALPTQRISPHPGAVSACSFDERPAVRSRRARRFRHDVFNGSSRARAGRPMGSMSERQMVGWTYRTSGNAPRAGAGGAHVGKGRGPPTEPVGVARRSFRGGHLRCRGHLVRPEHAPVLRSLRIEP